LGLDFETIKQDFNMTLDILCEEFRGINERKKQKKIKKKIPRQIKINEVCGFFSEF
jgi:acid stress-induced BolA-like protein IbaG/YrbA